MKIVLIYPNQTQLKQYFKRVKIRTVGYRSRPYISLGMLYLASNTKNHDIVYIDNNIRKLSTFELVETTLKYQPDAVGFGGTLTEFPQARDAAKELKKHHVITIYGGPNATANPVKHIKYFDYVVSGEGENVLSALLDNLEKNKIPDLPGVCFYVDGKDIIKPPVFNTDLDKLEYPARHLININDYCRKIFGQRSADIIISSRGCPYSCRFCSSKYIWCQKYKARSVNLLIDEIKFMISRYGTKVIHFREDNFTVDRKRLLKFCRLVKRVGIKWVCQSRVDCLDEVTVKIMKDSGCCGIMCGFESANDSTLSYIKKGITFEQICNTINMFEKVGMPWSGGFMVGVLNEGEKEIAKTLNFVKRVRSYTHSRLPRGAMRFVGFPVSEMYLEMINKGLVEYNWQDGELLVPCTYQLSATEVEKIIKRYW